MVRLRSYVTPNNRKESYLCWFLFLCFSQNPCTKPCTAWTLVRDFANPKPPSSSLLYAEITTQPGHFPFPSWGSNTYHVPHLVTKIKWQESSSVYTSSSLGEHIRQWMVQDANAAEEVGLGGGGILTLEEAIAPTKEEVQLLEDAIQALYDEQNFIKAESLLTKAIAAWVRQPMLEQAELYQLRGDCSMFLRRPAEALKDYAVVVKFLQSTEVDDMTPPDDKQRLYLAMARALRSKGVLSTDPTISSKQQAEAAKYYELSFSYSSSNDETQDYEERQILGLMKNPFAAWEYADALRGSGDLNKAAILHQISSDAFDNVGDKARALISDLDAVIDLAAANKVSLANKILLELLALKQVEARDVKVLQRVIAKKGEAQIAVAAALWDSNDKSSAEAQYGEACLRLEQLDMQDSKQKQQANEGTSRRPRNSISDTKDSVSLGFSIDDLPGAGEISCAKFKNDKFLSETLRWPPSLTEKLSKLEKLKQ